MSRACQIALPAALTAALLSGCPPPSPSPQPTTQPRQAASRPAPATRTARVDMALSLELPKRRFTMGEEFKIRLTARNISNRTVRIPVRPGGPIKVRIWRQVALGWDEIRVYPQAHRVTTHPWQLEPGQERSFEMVLTVEPDWPTHDTVAVLAELNGRPDLRARDTIRIAPAPTTAEADK